MSKSQKTKPQKIVEECEDILKQHGVGGIVVVMDEENGYYGLTMPHDSLFQWNEDESKVSLSLEEATEDQIDEEFHTLKTLHTMMDYCVRSVEALGSLLEKAVSPAPKVKDNRYDN